MIRRGPSGLAFRLPAAGGVRGVGTSGKQPDAALVCRAFGPSFGNQDLRIALRQFQPIAHFRFLKVYAVNHFGVLANQADGGSLIGGAMIAVFAARHLVSDALPFVRTVQVHLVGGSNTLTANNMPIVDGTNLGGSVSLALDVSPGRQLFAHRDGRYRRFGYVEREPMTVSFTPAAGSHCPSTKIALCS